MCNIYYILYILYIIYLLNTLKTWRGGRSQPTAQPIARKAPVRTVGPGCGRAVGWACGLGSGMSCELGCGLALWAGLRAWPARDTGWAAAGFWG